MKLRSFIYMVLASICIGTIGIFVKLIGNNIHFMTLNFYRLFFALIFIISVMFFYNRKLLTSNPSSKTIKNSFMIGFFMAATFSCLNIAFLHTSVQNAALLNESYPFFVLLFSIFLLREQITKSKIIVLILAIIGLVIMNPFSVNENLFGNSIALISAVTNAFLVIYMRKAKDNCNFQSVLYSFLFAALLLLPFPFIYGWGDIAGTIFYILGLGFISTGLSYFLYKLALKHLEAGIGALLEMMIAPLVAIILAFIILNEQIHTKIIVGGIILISAAIYLKIQNNKVITK